MKKWWGQDTGYGQCCEDPSVLRHSRCEKKATQLAKTRAQLFPVDQETKLEPAKQGSREERQKADSGFNTTGGRQERHPAYEILTIQPSAYLDMAAN